MARAVLVVVAVCSTTAAFAPPARTASRAVAPRAQKEPMNADGTKKRSEMTDWEIYTDGEYGRAFKFPWEVEATESRPWATRFQPQSSSRSIRSRVRRARGASTVSSLS